MKILNKMLPVMAFMTLLTGAAVGTVYAEVLIPELPIDLPFKAAVMPNQEIPGTSKAIMNQWRDVTYYEPPEKIEDFSELINELDLIEKSKTEIFEMFPLIESSTLDEYWEANPTTVENGYEKFFMDKVDLLNTPTGIKTIHGDDVLAVDAINGIMVIGKDVVSDSGTSKVKLAIVNNKKQVDLSVVKDLGYWEPIKDHVDDARAILGINASSYNWSTSGNYAILYGATKYHGEVIRKAKDNIDLVGFKPDGTMGIGGTIEDYYNAVEMLPTLIKDGVVVYEAADTDDRCAQTVIGQTEDGKTMLLVASGGVYGSNLGSVPAELAEIMKTYGAHNAICLGGGSRSIMYWNGRIVNETVGYSTTGVRLPNAWLVYPAPMEKSEDTNNTDSTVNTVN